jgi:hypothetical protein
MKIFRNLVYLFSLTLLLIACGKTGDNPTTVAKNFFTALAKKEYDKAAQHATKDSKTMLDLIKSLEEMGNNLGANTDLKNTDDEKIQNAVYSEAVIEGDKATVKVTMGDEVNDIKLVKEDGLWKVALDKDTLKETAAEKSGIDSTEINQNLDEAIKELEGISADSMKNMINKAGNLLKSDSVRKAMEAAGEALKKAGEAMKQVSKENQ